MLLFSLHQKLIKAIIKQGRFNLVDQKAYPWLVVEKSLQAKNIDQAKIIEQYSQKIKAEGILLLSLTNLPAWFEMVAEWVEPESSRLLGSHKVRLPRDYRPDQADSEHVEVAITGLAIKFQDRITGTIP